MYIKVKITGSIEWVEMGCLSDSQLVYQTDSLSKSAYNIISLKLIYAMEHGMLVQHKHTMC